MGVVLVLEQGAGVEEAQDHIHNILSDEAIGDDISEGISYMWETIQIVNDCDIDDEPGHSPKDDVPD